MTSPKTRFGKYELLEKIGTGGMAEIYKATVAGPDGFEKLQVVKKILPMYAQNRSFIKMLIAEAKVSSVLQHANIVQIFELGEIDEQYYIAMEWVNGPDLLHILTECTRRNIRMKAQLVLFMVSEICKGLAYAHSATDTKGRPLNIIHRDVSPSNVLISREGDVKVMDFGVARADLERASHDRRHKTAEGVLKGKLGYMSTEQVIGAEIDHRSDIFALGIMLFESLTLKRLFLGKTDLDTLINIRDVKIDGKLRKHDYIPQGIQQLIRKALAKDPRDRFQSASDFQEAILDYLFENRLRVSNRMLSDFVLEILAPAPADQAASKGKGKGKDKDKGKKRKKRSAKRRSKGDEATRSLQPAPSSPDVQVSAVAGDSSGEVSVADIVDTTPPRPVDAPDAAAEPAEHVTLQPTSEGAAVDVSDPDAAADEATASERPASEDATPDGEPAAESGVESEPAADSDPELLEGTKDRRELAAEARGETRERLDQTDLMKATFRLRHADGDIFGPINFGNLAQLLQNRSVSASELISVDEREFTPIVDITAIRELEPALFEAEAEPARFEGPISVLMTPWLFYQLSVTRVAGKLKYTRGTLTKETYFQNGEPVHITSSLKDDLLGAFMVERNLVKPEELGRAVNSVRDHGGRLGDALVRLGMLKPHDLYRVLELQFRQKFLELFTWQRGWYEFFEGHQPPEEIVWMGNDTIQLITVGVRTQFDLAGMRRIFAPYLDQVVVLQANPHITHNNLRFNSRELRFYTYLEDGKTLRETIRRYGRTEDECLTLLQVIFVLHQTDLLSFRATRPSSRPTQ